MSLQLNLLACQSKWNPSYYIHLQQTSSHQSQVHTKTIHHNPDGHNAVTHELPVSDIRYNRLTTIHLLQSAATHPVLLTLMQLHIDGRANHSTCVH